MRGNIWYPYGRQRRAARQRNDMLIGIESLDVPSEARTLAAAIISKKLLPPKAAYDALHVAVAAISGMDYLLTWNGRESSRLPNDVRAVRDANLSAVRTAEAQHGGAAKTLHLPSYLRPGEWIAARRR